MVEKRHHAAHGTWAGEYEGPAGVIAEAEAAFAAGTVGKSALSSDYYAYATRLRADALAEPDLAKRAKLLEWAAEYFKKAEALSDEYAAEKNGKLTAEECDVRQSILHGVRRLADARSVVAQGLSHQPKQGRLHTEALLLIGKAEIELDSGAPEHDVLPYVESAASWALQVAKEDELQAIRVYRGLARCYKRLGNTNAYHAAVTEAKRLIHLTGATDQEKKLEFDITER